MHDARLSRRGLLLGAGALTAAGAAVIAGKVLPARRIWNDLTGACGPAGPLPPAADVPVSIGTFVSKTVAEPVGYAIAVPAGVASSRTPFAVMLPGRSGTAATTMSSTCFPDFVTQAAANGTPPFALAAVDGGDSYWHRRADGEDRMAMLIHEFLPMLVERFGAGAIAIVGWSMGGYGALLAAERHPERFAAVAAASPAIFTSYADLVAGGGDAFDSADDFAQHDVIAGAGRLAGVPVRIDCGTADPFYRDAQTFVRALPTAPEGSWFRGCHDPDPWRNVASAQVAFLGQHLAARNP